MHDVQRLRIEASNEELSLWSFLRDRQIRGWKFRHQHHFGGGVIASFYCPKARIAVALSEEEAKNVWLFVKKILVVVCTPKQIASDIKSCLDRISKMMPERSAHPRHRKRPTDAQLRETEERRRLLGSSSGSMSLANASQHRSGYRRSH